MWTPDTRLARHFTVRELDPEGAADGKHRDRLRELAGVLEIIRERTARPVIVTPSGGYQPPAEQQSRPWPPRKPTSQHRQARAADIVVRGMSSVDVANLVIALCRGGVLDAVGGVGCYRGFVHVDTRPRRARQTLGYQLAMWAGDGIDLDRSAPRFSLG